MNTLYESDFASEDLLQQDELLSQLAGMNVSAFRILLLLKALCHHSQVALTTLNQSLLNSPLVARTFTNETIRKYLYTLARLQYDIQTTSRGEQTKYKLLCSPIKYRLSMQELHALHEVFSWLQKQPIQHKYKQLLELTQQLVPFFKVDNGYPKTWLKNDFLLEEKPGNEIYDSTTLEKYCFDSQVLQITYKTRDLLNPITSEKLTILMAPEQLRYQSNGIYFVGCNLENQRKIVIHTNHILNIKQLPKRVNTQAIQTTVMFKLTDRVARNYKPHGNESILAEEDALLIKHKTDEPGLLLRRLMRYGKYCEVISPESVREEMQHLIEGQLRPFDDYPNIADKKLVDALLQGSLGQRRFNNI